MTILAAMKSVLLKIYGKVQGVYFRQSTVEKARELGVKGWVRNCDDGTVEAEAEGDDSRVDQLVEWCRRGPRHAAVSKVEIQPSEIKNFSDFRISRG